MELSSEIFVMVIFITGVPILFSTLRDSDLPGNRQFMATYLILAFSNIFTVVEELCLNSLFNFLEHLFIAAASFVFLAAVMRLTSRQQIVSKPGAGETRE